MRPFLALVAVALCCALGAAPASAARMPALGIGDQKASAFGHEGFRKLGVKRSRYVAPWNLALKRDERRRFDDWLAAARGAGVREVMVAFNASRGSLCPRRPCRLPSVRSYTRAFRAFRRLYPTLRVIQPWNEANSPTQPTGPWYKGARAAALYYNVVRRYCRGCQVTAADLLDLSERSVRRWLQQFGRYADGRPRLWGLHNYTDSNRRSGMTRRILGMIPGRVWLTETGGIVYFRKASGAVNFKFDERRAARSLKRTFAIARKYRSRISRLYLYQWSIDFSGNRFDAGLVRATGKVRPGYWIVRRYRSWVR